MTQKQIFAEHLANTGCARISAARMGKDALYGNAMVQKLRKDLGPQAV